MPRPVVDIDLPEVAGGSRGLTGALAVPDGPGPWPGVVLVFEAYGLNDVMRRQVARLADAGYLALMPDLFAEGGARRCLGATFRALRAGEGRAFVDIETARAELAARADCTGAIGVLGFCMGGGFALAAAINGGFSAASANYGMLPKDLDALAGACPVVGSYGARDRSLRGAAATLERVLAEHDVPHDVKEYPTAGHSFLNDEETGPPLVRMITRPILGAGPEPEAAADAWKRIEAFFAEHLGGPRA
ncbi:dienelactone hydrolase family protein [Pseudolysinimonas sp.]|uniref:dienelactone hydrolase family protein n=1 Tax=Pseudolysinimonas sp. TaxID=2680009 RepID=UPI003F7D9DBE